MSSNSTVDKDAIFAIVHAKLYVPVLTFSIYDNAKQLQKFKLGSKGIVL